MGSFQVSQELCIKRAKFLINRLYDVQSTSKENRYSHYSIDHDAALSTVEAYFLLSDAYKAHRQIPDDHRTEFSKVAALMALAIGYMCPLRHKDLHRDSCVDDQLINPIFAVRLALQRISPDITLLSHEEKDRLYEGFRGFQFRTLERYYISLRDGTRQLFDPFDIEFSAAELIFIEDKITIFALCERLSQNR